VPVRVSEYKSFKELLDDMNRELELNLEGLRGILKILLEEQWRGSGEGSASYPRMRILVDPNDELIKNQVIPVLSEVVNNVRALRSSIAIFKTLFSKSELETELKLKAIWDGSHVRVVIVSTT